MTTHFPSYDGIKSLLIGLTSALCNVFTPPTRNDKYTDKNPLLSAIFTFLLSFYHNGTHAMCARENSILWQVECPDGVIWAIALGFEHWVGMWHEWFSSRHFIGGAPIHGTPGDCKIHSSDEIVGRFTLPMPNIVCILSYSS